MKEIALHILDIAENSVSAGAANITLSIRVDHATQIISVWIEDDGIGMSEEVKHNSENPFYTSKTSRKVGLGIPLLKQHAEMTGGKLTIDSEAGAGTTVRADFVANHPDIQPLGDIEGCWVLLASSYPGIDIKLKFETNTGEYEISSNEVMEYLELDSLQSIEVMDSLKRMIRNNIDDLSLGMK